MECSYISKRLWLTLAVYLCGTCCVQANCASKIYYISNGCLCWFPSSLFSSFYSDIDSEPESHEHYLLNKREIGFLSFCHRSSLCIVAIIHSIVLVVGFDLSWDLRSNLTLLFFFTFFNDQTNEIEWISAIQFQQQLLYNWWNTDEYQNLIKVNLASALPNLRALSSLNVTVIHLIHLNGEYVKTTISYSLSQLLTNWNRKPEFNDLKNFEWSFAYEKLYVLEYGILNISLYRINKTL